MEILVSVVFLAIVSILLNQRAQTYLKAWFYEQPGYIFLVSWTLAMFVCFVAGQGGGAVRWDLRNLIYSVFAFTFIPAFLIYNSGRWHSDNKTGRADSWIEFAVLLILWLPIEFAMTVNSGRWLKSFLFNSTHILAYGVAVTLGLSFFLLFKQMDGVKYNLPRSRNDFAMPFFGLLVAMATLIPIGLWLKFIGPFNIPTDLSSFKVIKTFSEIFLGVALPEEILFRGLLQNWLMQKLGFSNKTLLLSALIFGAAHLNNGPGALPNWRYMILATIAGFIYGKVFQRSNSIFASASLHAAANTIRHVFFA